MSTRDCTTKRPSEPQAMTYGTIVCSSSYYSFPRSPIVSPLIVPSMTICGAPLSPREGHVANPQSSSAALTLWWSQLLLPLLSLQMTWSARFLLRSIHTACLASAWMRPSITCFRADESHWALTIQRCPICSYHWSAAELILHMACPPRPYKGNQKQQLLQVKLLLGKIMKTLKRSSNASAMHPQPYASM